MKIKVLYFAGARDTVAKGKESLELREGASVEDLAAEILRLHPAFAKVARSVRFSVNLEVAARRTVLHDADQVGVLPPVAGG